MTNNNDKNTSNNEPLLMNHDYDGIQELDNPLPNWWLILFFVTIGFGVLYFFHYHLGGGGLNSVQELNVAMQKIEAQKQASLGADQHGAPATGGAAAGGAAGGDLQALLNDQATLATGKAAFDSTCASCHGKAGEGMIGPNLTDNFWIHGDGSVMAVHKVVVEGVLDKGMPAWGNVLTPDKVNAVSVYVVSLKGSNPPNGKAPQGTEIK